MFWQTYVLPKIAFLFCILYFRCLEETGYDITKAEVAFRNAQQEGKIPIEAFEQ